MTSLVTTILLSGSTLYQPVHAFSTPAAVPNLPGSTLSNGYSSSATASSVTVQTVAYKTIPLPLTGFGINVLVAVWYPVNEEEQIQSSDNHCRRSSSSHGQSTSPTVQYDYQISVRRIGELLANWDFIPNFATRKFSFAPQTKNVVFVNGENVAMPTQAKVVVLTHGFLGSRFDLSHVAEDLASKGFVCVAPEYPESLEASYSRLEGLDRSVVNERLLQWIRNTIPTVTSWASIGHSMGAGTALDIGDDSWNRVLMGIGRAPELPGSRTPDVTALYPLKQVGGRLLFISSVNDGAVKWSGGIQVPHDYTILQESQLLFPGVMSQSTTSSATTGEGRHSLIIPDRAALIFDRKDAPNHISFLSESVNEAMISFLAPLLPVAQAFDIPVLDFDKYVISRDSVSTADVLKPLISEFLMTERKVK